MRLGLLCSVGIGLAALGVGACSDDSTAAPAPATTTTSSGGGAGSNAGGGGAGADGGGGGSGGSESFCDTLAAALQEALDTSTEAANRPGGTVAAMDTPECELWVGASGQASPDTPLSPTALMRVGSVTKTYTAAAIVALVDAGELSYEDTIDQWLSGVPNESEITVRQLLSHTSGVYNITDDAAFMSAAMADPEHVYTPQEVVDAAAAHGASFAPGTSWEYSNTNYTLLGMILQAVSGTSVSAAIRTRFLTPLSLDRTFLDGEETLPEPLAMGYGPGGVDHTVVVHPSLQWTAGSMVAEIGDLTRWASHLYVGDALSAAAKTEMLTFIATGTANVEYGLGVYRIEVADPHRIGHPGHIFGYGAMMFWLPEDDVVLSVVVNSAEGAAQAHFVPLCQAYAATRVAQGQSTLAQVSSFTHQPRPSQWSPPLRSLF